MDNPFAQLNISTEQKQQLKEVDKRQMELGQAEKEAIAEYENNLKQALDGKQKEVNSSKLEQAIEKNKGLAGDLGKIVESIVYQLGDYGQLVANMSQRTGLEKAIYHIPLVGQKWANGMLRSRADKQSVDDKLKSVLDYALFMKERVYQLILQNKGCQLEIEQTHGKTLKKLNQDQPNYEQWRSQKETLERQLREVSDKLDLAGETERPALEQQKTGLTASLQEAVYNENHYFIIVKVSKESIDIQRKHIKAYSDTLGALDVIRTLLDNKVQDMTSVYQKAPVVIKTALAMKGAAEVDTAMNATTDKITDAVLSSVEGMLDESASRAEKAQIGNEKSEAYRKFQTDMYDKYIARMEALKRQYAKPDGQE